MSKLKPNHRSLRNTLQFLKQFPDLPLQLELIKVGDLYGFGLPTKARDADHSEVITNDRLPATDWDILNSSELVTLHRL